MTHTIHILHVEFGSHSELRLVAMLGEQIVGVCNLAGFGKVVSTIFQLFVKEDVRGRGIGAELVKAACEQAMKRGAMAVSAIIEPFGPKGFWAAQGFLPAHCDGSSLLVVRQLSVEDKLWLP